jgi:hypothetical protein
LPSSRRQPMQSGVCMLALVGCGNARDARSRTAPERGGTRAAAWVVGSAWRLCRPGRGQPRAVDLVCSGHRPGRRRLPHHHRVHWAAGVGGAIVLGGAVHPGRDRRRPLRLPRAAAVGRAGHLGLRVPAPVGRRLRDAAGVDRRPAGAPAVPDQRRGRPGQPALPGGRSGDRHGPGHDGDLPGDHPRAGRHARASLGCWGARVAGGVRRRLPGGAGGLLATGAPAGP